jgi:superfamily II helicase
MDNVIDKAIAESITKVGYMAVRPHQKSILEKLLAGQDCMLIAPTGSGKSLIFEAALKVSVHYDLMFAPVSLAQMSGNLLRKLFEQVDR